MVSHRILPSAALQPWIECYWMVESDAPPHQQKIIPDGFPEMIFHYKDPYRINLSGQWELQSSSLLAGQIHHYFFLENTGASGMIGIKLKPAAVAQLFSIDMYTLTDKVADLLRLSNPHFAKLDALIRNDLNHERVVNSIEQFFYALTASAPKNQPIDTAVSLILQSKGVITVAEICSALQISERHLERLFKKFIGLPPKYFMRVIRFSHLFQLVEKGDPSWSDLAFESGYYDQSHFIRNFKAFTGEDPSSYLFGESTLANFLMKKN